MTHQTDARKNSFFPLQVNIMRLRKSKISTKPSVEKALMSDYFYSSLANSPLPFTYILADGVIFVSMTMKQNNSSVKWKL